MIKFKSIEYKNILATGNHPIHIQLDKCGRTLIFGKNGRGKSTILTALSYSLFGKDFRGITKDKIVNSINKKNAEAITVLEKNGSEYSITRGIKPDTFIVTKDGEPVLADGGSKKELQSYVEEHILGFGFDTFKQIVVIASGKYQPFMLLSAPERRRVVETILSLDVFSEMTASLKRDFDALNAEISNADREYSNIETKLQTQRALVKKLENYNTEAIADKKASVIPLENSNKNMKSQVDELLVKIADVSSKIVDTSKHESALTKLEHICSESNVEIRNSQREVKFLNDNDTCPTCKNVIDLKYKNEKIEQHNNTIAINTKSLTENKEKHSKINDFVKNVRELSNEVSKLSSEMRVLNARIDSNENQIKSIFSDIEKLESNSNNDTTGIKKEIEELEKELQEKLITKDGFHRRKSILTIARSLLADSAIKAEVIEQFIPLFNEYMNYFLEKLDFYVEFTLDSNFDETIKSRYRDNFKYSNFSEGEKQRIDLAILFAWREVAKHRNNVHTNLLFLDEIADGSMDVTGIENMLKIFEEMDSNIFIISHSDLLKEVITDTIEFTKEKNFSIMKETR